MMQHTQNIFPVGVRREEENETPARPDWAEEAAQGSEARRDDAVRSEGDLQLVDTGRGRRRSCRARAHCMGLRARIGGCEMTTETRTITVQAYRDEDGQPTCAADFQQGHVCRFLGSRKFGTQDTCLAKNTDVFRRFSGPPYGFLVPVVGCPVWSEE